jgi:hypothetical protein
MFAISVRLMGIVTSGDGVWASAGLAYLVVRMLGLSCAGVVYVWLTNTLIEDSENYKKPVQHC